MSFAEYTYQDHKKNLNKSTVSKLNIAYIDEGTGPVTVLLHGIPTNSWMYRKIIKGLSKTNRVIAPDLIGFGQSQKVKKAFSVAQHSKIIHELLTKNLKISSFKLIVHDFGGAIAWDMLQYNDFKVTELIILNTFLFKDGWNHNFNFFTNLANHVLPSLLSTSFFEMAVKDMFFDPKQSAHCFTGYSSPFKEKYAKKGYKKLYSTIPNLEKHHLENYQSNSKVALKNVPKKIIWGRHDKFLDSNLQLKAIVKYFNIPSNNILILENGKHLIADENADEILKFIATD